LRDLEKALGLKKDRLRQSLLRLAEAGLIRKPSGVGASDVRLGPAIEFFEHAVKYLVPTKVDAESPVLGMPTAWAASPLREALAVESGSAPWVWPAAEGGTVEGWPVRPLISNVVDLARQDADLYRALACVDALRLGRARERELARRYLVHTIRHAQQVA
jgi:hypothetical protein